MRGNGTRLPATRFYMLALATLVGGCATPAVTAQPGRGSGDPYYQANVFDAGTERSSAKQDPASGETGTVTPPAGGRLVSTHGGDLPGKPFQPGEVVAIVGNEPILVGDMLLEVNQILNQNLVGAPPEIFERERRNVIAVLADRFVEARMLYQDGIAQLPDGVDVEKILEQAEGDFDEKVLPQLLQRSKIESANGYDAHLRSLGSSLRQFRRNWAREQLAQHFLREKLKVNEDISHAELLQYYRDNIQQFQHPSRARWEELMVLTSRFPDAATARSAINKMGDKVLYGASFQEVAKEFSHGLTATDGGQYDWTTEGSLVSKELDTQIFALPVDYLSDVIESAVGLHIVRVIEREQAHTTPFRDAQPEIRKKLLEVRHDEAIQRHLAELRKKIPHEIVFER